MISVVIPAHNEARTIERNIKRVEKYLKENFKKYEIVVSEDGSTDGTDRILERLSKRKGIVSLHHGGRLGKGEAVKRGVFRSGGDLVFLLDADIPIELSSIRRLVERAGEYDIVMASRLLKGSKTTRSLSRSVASRCYNLLVRLLFSTGVQDHQCGVKVFRRGPLVKVLNETESRGFFWDTEVIVRSKSRGYTMGEVPVEWKDREQKGSKVSVPREGFRMLKNMIKLRVKLGRGKSR